MVTRYGQADIPREVSGRGRPAVGPAAADFPRCVCLTVSRNHKVFLLYSLDVNMVFYAQIIWGFSLHCVIVYDACLRQ